MHRITLKQTVENIITMKNNLQTTYLILDNYYKDKAESLDEKMDLILDMFNIVNSYKQIEKDLEELQTQLQIAEEEAKANGN